MVNKIYRALKYLKIMGVAKEDGEFEGFEARGMSEKTKNGSQTLYLYVIR